MFSKEFMKYLYNYRKTEFTPEPTKKEIRFKPPTRGRKILAAVAVAVSSK